jgi:hypothetical protein
MKRRTAGKRICQARKMTALTATRPILTHADPFTVAGIEPAVPKQEIRRTDEVGMPGTGIVASGEISLKRVFSHF